MAAEALATLAQSVLGMATDLAAIVGRSGEGAPDRGAFPETGSSAVRGLDADSSPSSFAASRRFHPGRVGL